MASPRPLSLLAAALALSPRAAATDPVGVWPLQPEPEVVRPFDPPDSPYGAGHRGVDLLGARRPAGARGAARHGHLRRPAGRPRGRRGRPRRHPHDLRAGHRHRRRRHTGRARAAALGTLDAAGLALLPAGLPALGLDRGRDLPRPAAPGRRRPGPAAAAVADDPVAAPPAGLLDQPDRVAADVRRPGREVGDRARERDLHREPAAAQASRGCSCSRSGSGSRCARPGRRGCCS